MWLFTTPTSNFGASLVVQLVKNPLVMQETLVRSQGQEDPLEKGQTTHSNILGLPLWLSLNVGDLGSIPWLGRSPGEGKGCLLQYSGLENFRVYNPLAHSELDGTERLSLYQILSPNINYKEVP